MKSLLHIVWMTLLFSCTQNAGKKYALAGQEPLPVTVLTFNMWQGSEAANHQIGEALEVIKVSGGTIAGLQETYSWQEDGSHTDNGAILAEMLGWNYFSHGSSGILTPYEICDTTANNRGVKLRLDENRYIWFFNSHLFHMPYQPYQLGNKEYGDFPFISTAEEAIQYARQARFDETASYIREIASIESEGLPVILTGDFNEPSHLDWTEKAAEAGLYPIPVSWPTTSAYAETGLKDAWRVKFPDEVQKPGHTWSSIDSPGEIHDRIDFVLFKGEQLEVRDAATLGSGDGISDITIENYPSDHRAVRILFQMK